MSAWYIFSALGFYPVDPAAAKYVIGTPFFESAELRIPGTQRPLRITAEGAAKKPYIRSVHIDGKAWNKIEIPHAVLADGANVIFEMADTPQTWGT